MKRIFKYDVQIWDHFFIQMPKESKILTIQTQRNTPRIWAIIDDEIEETEFRKFRVFGTGQPINEKLDRLRYVGTFQHNNGNLIYHTFEIIE